MKQLFFINKYIQLTLSTILILLYCSFIPLFIDKGGFFALQEAKFYVLYNNRQIICLLLILLVLSIIIENKQNLKQWLKNSINTFDIVSLIFLVIVILSCRLSLSFKLTWLGTSGFYVGGYVLSLAILSRRSSRLITSNILEDEFSRILASSSFKFSSSMISTTSSSRKLFLSPTSGTRRL